MSAQTYALSRVCVVPQRIANYEAVYETIADDSLSYVKLINLQSKVCMCVRVGHACYVARVFHCNEGRAPPRHYSALTLPSVERTMTSQACMASLECAESIDISWPHSRAQVVVNKIFGIHAKRLMNYFMALHTVQRPIYLTRAGHR